MGVVDIGGDEGGVVVFSATRPLFAFLAGVAGSAAERHGLSNRTSQDFWTYETHPSAHLQTCFVRMTRFSGFQGQ
jgi:hypothetical protein